MSKKNETRFKESVSKRLKELPNTWFVKIQQVAIRGIPDFLMCINGYFVGLELKKDEESIVEPLQEWTLEAIARAGGISFVTHPDNFEDVYEVLKDLAHQEVKHSKVMLDS